ncbi:uncharacterized protein KZ484_024775 [Pholidichthys leucotaenia]
MEDAGNYSCAIEAHHNISSSKKALTVMAREKSVRVLNGVKVTLLLLIPSGVLLFCLLTRKKTAETGVSKRSNKVQTDQLDPLYESIAMVVMESSTQRKSSRRTV